MKHLIIFLALTSHCHRVHSPAQDQVQSGENPAQRMKISESWKWMAPDSSTCGEVHTMIGKYFVNIHTKTNVYLTLAGAEAAVESECQSDDKKWSENEIAK